MILLSFAALVVFQLSAVAEDNAAAPAKTNRPAPEFDHTLHEEALEEAGCGACHHVFDDEKNRLVYAEGEELACIECHLETAQGTILAIREANHASCTACHRDLKKQKETAGPTTCGECHKKQP